MILPNWRSDPRIRVRFLDIIMLAAEMDVTNIPVEHPDATNFVFDRPFMGKLLIWSSATARFCKRIAERSIARNGRHGGY